jgi:hypothetical protein
VTTVKRRKPTSKVDLAHLASIFAEHRRAKAAATAATAVANAKRDEITPIIEKFGTPHGDKGQHKVIELPEPVDGCTKLVRRANKSTFINVDRAEAMAQKGKFLEQIQEGRVTLMFAGDPRTARQVLKQIKDSGLLEVDGVKVGADQQFSQERLLAFHQRHRDTKLTEKMLDSLYDTDITYSFNPE